MRSLMRGIEDAITMLSDLAAEHQHSNPALCQALRRIIARLEVALAAHWGER